MAKNNPLSDVDRQRRRREKLKAKAEKEKYAPEPFIADAVGELFSTGDISKELRDKIIKTALQQAKAALPDMNPIMQKYVENCISDLVNRNIIGD